MKKILFIGLCCLCLCGCGKNDKIAISELTITYSPLGNDVSGTIQNKSSKSISNAKIVLTLQSGNLKQKCFFYTSNMTANETKKLDTKLFCDEFELSDQPNFEDYKIKKKSIEYIHYDE